MIWQEWLLLVEEVENLWPLSPPWPADTVRYLFERFKAYSSEDVKAAILSWFEAGNKWPPMPSELAAAVRNVVLFKPDVPKLDTSSGPLLTLKEWLEKKGFENLEEAIFGKEKK